MVGRFDVRARADQPHALPGPGCDSPCAAASPSRRGHRAAARHRPRRASGRAGHALAAGDGVGRQAKGGRLLARAGRRALDSLAPSEAAKLFGDALEMLGSAARRRAVRGADRARRGAAPDGGCRATARRCSRRRGIAAELGDAELAARAALANNRGFVSSYGGQSIRSGSRRSSGRSSSTTRPQPARHARLLALLAHGAGVRTGPRPAPARWPMRRSRSPARRPIRGRSRRCSKSSCYAIWAPDTLATRSEQVRELSALVAQVAGSARRVRRQATGDEYGDRAGRFWAGRRGARARSGDRGADTAADAEMERRLPRRRDDVHARRAWRPASGWPNRRSDSDRRQVNPTPR